MSKITNLMIKLFELNPFILFGIVAVLTILFAFLTFVSPGLSFGIDLQGGSLVILQTDKQIDAAELEQFLNSEFALKDLKVSTTASSVLIQFAEEESIASAELLFNQARDSGDKQLFLNSLSSIQSFIEQEKVPEDGLQDFVSDKITEAKKNFQVSLSDKIKQKFSLSSDSAFQFQEIGPVVGNIFWQNAQSVFLIAIFLIIIVIFIFFREIIPSITIVMSASFDVLTALAFMAVFQVPVSLVSIPALLMLIGYSIDTDIMLTARVLKRTHATPIIRAVESMETGLTMTITSLAAAFLMMVLSSFAQIIILFQIAFVLTFGLFGDLIATWLLNAPLLLMYKNRKKKSSEQ